MARLVLIRHAESAGNAAGVIDSRPPGSGLSARGREQATNLAHRLADACVVSVRASSTVRAQETASVVAAFHGLEVQCTDDLLEIDCGELEGRHDGDALGVVKATFERWIAGERHVRLPGGESWDQIQRRMLRAVPDTRPERDGDYVVVGHSGSLRIAVAAIAGVDAAEKVGYPVNCGVTILIANGARSWRLERWDAGESEILETIGRRLDAPE
jgi:broad specificity phosphatase PhoE